MLAEASGGTPQVILIGTGSEVQLALAARETPGGRGRAHPSGLVAVPGVVRRPGAGPIATQVLPPAVRARVSVEAGIAQSWRDLVGDAGESVSLEHFGASAPFEVLYEQFGLTADGVVAAAKRSLDARAPAEAPPNWRSEQKEHVIIDSALRVPTTAPRRSEGNS